MYVGYITYLHLAVFLKHITNTIIAMMVTIPPTTAPTMIPVGSELSDLEYKNKASSLNLIKGINMHCMWLYH